MPFKKLYTDHLIPAKKATAPRRAAQKTAANR